MSYFVIGVSGVTSGGKTTVSKLLQRSFPWSKVIHQDKYFYPENYKGHVRLADIGDHINFELWTALDMEQMHRDVAKTVNSAPQFQKQNGHSDYAPNFAEGLELLRNLEDIDVDTSRFSHIPILILEGFTIYESEELFKSCDARFFLTLDEETCRRRRSLRNFDPPDGPGYFDHCIWPQYQLHYKKYIGDRAGTEIEVYSGKAPIGKIWRDSVELISSKIEEKFPYQIMAANANNNNF